MVFFGQFYYLHCEFKSSIHMYWEIISYLQKQLNYYMVQSYFNNWCTFFCSYHYVYFMVDICVIFVSTIYIILFILFNKKLFLWFNIKWIINQTETKSELVVILVAVVVLSSISSPEQTTQIQINDMCSPIDAFILLYIYL